MTSRSNRAPNWTQMLQGCKQCILEATIYNKTCSNHHRNCNLFWVQKHFIYDDNFEGTLKGEHSSCSNGYYIVVGMVGTFGYTYDRHFQSD